MQEPIEPEKSAFRYSELAEIEVKIYEVIQEKNPKSIQELCQSLPGHKPKKVLGVYRRMRKAKCVFYKNGSFTIAEID